MINNVTRSLGLRPQSTCRIRCSLLHTDEIYRRLGAKGSYLTLVRVADRIL